MKSKELPIGYWIRKADDLLTHGINHIQAKFGLARIDWQILHAIQQNKGSSKSELINLMQSFADNVSVEETLNRFRQQELVEENNAEIKLTSPGQQTHQECLKQQLNFREKSMNAISETEYQTTLLTLQKLVANLENY